jgi:hypothetical protein
VSAKRITITIREHPPCEFESVEDLERYVDRLRSQKKSRDEADWHEAMRRIGITPRTGRGGKGKQ